MCHWLLHLQRFTRCFLDIPTPKHCHCRHWGLWLSPFFITWVTSSFMTLPVPWLAMGETAPGKQEIWEARCTWFFLFFSSFSSSTLFAILSACLLPLDQKCNLFVDSLILADFSPPGILERLSKSSFMIPFLARACWQHACVIQEDQEPQTCWMIRIRIWQICH